MSIWIARDMDGELWLSVVKPKRLEDSFGHGSGYIIPKHHYPEVTWENSPKELVVKGE